MEFITKLAKEMLEDSHAYMVKEDEMDPSCDRLELMERLEGAVD